MNNEFLLTKSACLCQKAHLLAAEESRRKTEMGSFSPQMISFIVKKSFPW